VFFPLRPSFAGVGDSIYHTSGVKLYSIVLTFDIDLTPDILLVSVHRYGSLARVLEDGSSLLRALVIVLDDEIRDHPGP
jgi:hypothetical protein